MCTAPLRNADSGALPAIRMNANGLPVSLAAASPLAVSRAMRSPSERKRMLSGTPVSWTASTLPSSWRHSLRAAADAAMLRFKTASSGVSRMLRNASRDAARRCRR
jgi:hypothetical protein